MQWINDEHSQSTDLEHVVVPQVSAENIRERLIPTHCCLLPMWWFQVLYYSPRFLNAQLIDIRPTELFYPPWHSTWSLFQVTFPMVSCRQISYGSTCPMIGSWNPQRCCYPKQSMNERQQGQLSTHWTTDDRNRPIKCLGSNEGFFDEARWDEHVPQRKKILCCLPEGQQVSRTMREIGLVQYMRQGEEGMNPSWWWLKGCHSFTIHIFLFVVLIDWNSHTKQ